MSRKGSSGQFDRMIGAPCQGVCRNTRHIEGAARPPGALRCRDPSREPADPDTSHRALSRSWSCSPFQAPHRRPVRSSSATACDRAALRPACSGFRQGIQSWPWVSRILSSLSLPSEQRNSHGSSSRPVSRAANGGQYPHTGLFTQVRHLDASPTLDLQWLAPLPPSLS